VGMYVYTEVVGICGVEYVCGEVVSGALEGRIFVWDIVQHRYLH